MFTVEHGRGPWGRVALLVALCALRSPPAVAVDCTFVVEGTAWLYHESPPPASWEQTATEDEPETTTWKIGCTPFGSDGCGFVAATSWPVGATWYVRQHVFLTGDESGLTAKVAIDNDFDLYVNGVWVAGLAKEGCATRWDSVIPLADTLWQPGDNVVALRIVDRGGLATFEFELTGSAPDTCPPGCAQLPCSEAGPDVMVPTLLACPGSAAFMTVDGEWSQPCATDLEYRFLDGSGQPISDWGLPMLWIPGSHGDTDVEVEARCTQSPTCPVGRGRGGVTEAPGPPSPVGPFLRVSRSGGLAVVDWSAAGPALAGEHDHLRESRDPAMLVVRSHRLEGEQRIWTDPVPGGIAHYRVRAADRCEREGPVR